MPSIVVQVLRRRGEPMPALQAVFDELGGSIGRADGNDLVLPDPEREVSRVHARIRFEGGRFTIEDRGAKPLHLNGKPVGFGRRVPLATGDRLALGDFELVVGDAPPDQTDAMLAPAPPVAAFTPEPPPAPRPPAPARPPATLPDDWDPFGDLAPVRPEPVAPPPALPHDWDPFDDLATPAPASAPATSIDELFGLGDKTDTPGAGDPFASFLDERTVPLGPVAPSGGSSPPNPEPVCFAVTAPQRLAAPASFVAALAVHVASMRDTAERQLQRLGGPQSEPLMDLPPARQSGWVAGAPVTVRLQVQGGHAEPEQQDFEWNGRLNLAAFRVHPDGSAALELGFHVLLAGVPMGLVPLTVELQGEAAEAQAAAPAPRAAPSSAFASYASADADAVGLCLSALTRWAPTLAIFQDCLDLRPGEAFKPQLEQRIATSEAFLLFWSRRAAASPWVRWELDTARRGKPAEALIPMPLEDPALAPPPPELADRHWRDRFMVARLGLAQVARLAQAGPDGPPAAADPPRA